MSLEIFTNTSLGSLENPRTTTAWARGGAGIEGRIEPFAIFKDIWPSGRLGLNDVATTELVSHSDAREVGVVARPAYSINSDHMGVMYCNYPVVCTCGKKHEYPHPDHKDGAPCPFIPKGFPRALIYQHSCCMLWPFAAAEELLALGCDDLSRRMYDDLSAEEAATFASQLQGAAFQLEVRFLHEREKPQGRWVRMDRRSSFQEAVSTIVWTARWYETVSSRGYGVGSWVE